MRLVVFGLVLLFAACTLPPVVYHDGLPAQPPGPSELAVRGQVGFWEWNGAEGLMGYYLLGARVGGEFGKMSVDGGLGMLYTSPFIQMGLGLSRPALMLRGMTTFDGWWQASLLGGPPRRSSGFNWSAGLASSMLGFGPSVTLENRWGDFTVRGQGSVTWRAPWADSIVKGQVVSLGIAVEPSISLKRKATADTTKPR